MSRIPKRLTSLENALLILKSFTLDKPEQSVTEIAQSLNVAKSTAHRLLSSLNKEGFVVKDRQTNLYSLGSSILSLTNIVNAQIRISNEVIPILNTLVEATSENAHLAIIEDLEIVYLQTMSGLYQANDFVHIGKRHPAFCTSSGQAILACHPSLAEKVANHLTPFTPYTVTSPSLFIQKLRLVKEMGYVICDKEFQPHICGIGAPVFNEKQEVIASINITADSKRANSPALQKRYIHAVQNAATQLSEIIAIRKRSDHL